MTKKAKPSETFLKTNEVTKTQAIVPACVCKWPIAAFRRCPVATGFGSRRTSDPAGFSCPGQSAPRPDLPDGCGLGIRVKPGAQKYSCLPKFGFGVNDAHP